MRFINQIRYALVGAVLCICLMLTVAQAALVNRSTARAALIPYPQQVHRSLGSFSAAHYSIQLPKDNDSDIVFIRELLHQVLRGMDEQSAKDDHAARPIILKYDTIAGVGHSEAYHLEVTPDHIVLIAPHKSGLFYGVQTLRQLVQYENNRLVVPCCEIIDWPAFSYRGFMHDVGRNFQDMELLKQHLDIMAQYKLNLFHFHLTDDPGYRIECRVYPQLNEPGNYRPTRQPGKYYTYQQINDLIAYARQRQIQVVPEIDMPGHSEYFKKTFGFDMQDSRGIAVLKDILREFFEHVDTPWFHMGSDEVQLKNPEFMREMVDFIRSKDKKVVVWRPGHLPDGQVITQLWRGQTTPMPGIPYLDSLANYINHLDPFDGPVCIFFQQPCRVPKGNALALGSILCHWPDNNIAAQMDIYTQTPVYPVLVTYADRIWRGVEKNREDCWAKLPSVTDPAFEEFAAFEEDLIVHRDRFFKTLSFPYVKQTGMPWRLIGPFDHKGNPQTVFPVEKAIQDEYTVDGRTFRWIDARGGTIHINHFFRFEGYFPSTNSGTAYGLSYIYSDVDRNVDFWIGFNGYSRSERRRGAPNPQQGQWSNTYSAIWVNDQPLSPPLWKQPGLGADLEIPFVDEDYFYRPPLQVSLRKGWNKILVKAPKTSATWKWMFTCIPIEWDGRQATEPNGLKYSAFPNLN